MIDATSFPDPEGALIAVIKAAVPVGTFVSNTTPPTNQTQMVIVGYSGGGGRDWGEAQGNAGINVYAATDKDCKALVTTVQNALATASDDLLERVAVPVGATGVPRQNPPFQRYFVVTAYLRGVAVL